MSLAKYIINIDELAAALGDRDIQINAEVSVDNLERLLDMRFDEALSIAQHSYEGYRQCVHGVRMDIPALAFDFELLHSFEQEVYLTGITYSQTGWKPSDRWSLYAGEDLLFDGLYTKELGEHKRFNLFRRVPEGTELKIVHHNNSGNSKRIWFDIEYLSKPGGDERDWKVIVEWVNGADIDCCWIDGETEQVLMGYSTGRLGKAPDIIYKDRDDTAENGKETWSISGRYADKLLFGLGWYSQQGPDEVSITVTLYDHTGAEVDRREDITGDMLGVCDDKSGEYLCVYEFDLTDGSISPWRRINKTIRN